MDLNLLSLTIHIRTHTMYNCTICGRAFAITNPCRNQTGSKLFRYRGCSPTFVKLG
ncbi:hypothetical protein BC833DRAFT_580722 [Globomyces pollinis-pini]|nr:hypothetical protein BC833DRAFT_580722 [Globomyces pollinis-pini]